MNARTLILHYTAPPIIGGVEAVIDAHVQAFLKEGYPVDVAAGRGEPDAFPEAVDLHLIPEMDSRHPEIMEMTEQLVGGEVPANFDHWVVRLTGLLEPVVAGYDNVIVHNVFTKHFNIPLTAALFRMLDQGTMPHTVAWCHDFTWTSPTSHQKVYPSYPWDLLRTYREDVTYVVVSKRRRDALAELFDVPEEKVHVVYNGVDPRTLLGLSEEGAALVERLGILESDLVLLMPVRVTRAKNIEFALRVVAALREWVEQPKLILTGPPDPHDESSIGYFRSLQELRGELGVEREMRFVYESGPDPDEPYTIEWALVGDLYRISDVMFMPSHREGFGMPVLEAGMVGIPVVSTDVPAAEEIGRPDVLIFDEDEDPGAVARRLLDYVEEQPAQKFRRRVRSRYTWPTILERDILPLLQIEEEGAA